MKKIVAVICAFLTLFAICSCESVLTPNDLATSFGRLTAANVGTITYVTEVKKDGVVTSLITAVFKGSDRSVFTTEKKLNADLIGKRITKHKLPKHLRKISLMKGYLFLTYSIPLCTTENMYWKRSKTVTT